MLGPSRESATSVPGLRSAALMTLLPFFSGSKLSWEVTLQLVQNLRIHLNPIPESSWFKILSCIQRESHHNSSTLGVEAEGQENSVSYLVTFQAGVFLGLYNICL